MKVNYKRVVKYGIDYAFLFAAMVCLLVLGVNIVRPTKTVISCEDPSIGKPYKHSTISIPTLVLGSVVAPFVVLGVVEWLCPPHTNNNNNSNTTLRSGLRRGWALFRHFGTGLVFFYTTVEILKVAVAEARPNFLDVCRPNITQLQCLQGNIPVTWRDCTNPYQQHELRMVDTMKSFPSGHAFVSAFSAAFMIIYLHQRLWARYPRHLAPCLYLVWASWAIVGSWSRVWDNKHHWWDVLIGGVLGIIAAIWTVQHMSHWFTRDHHGAWHGQLLPQSSANTPLQTPRADTGDSQPTELQERTTIP